MGRRKRLKAATGPVKLGDFLTKALSRNHIDISLLNNNFLTNWEKAVGPQISAQTEPYKLRNKILYVRVATSTWMQQLQYMKKRILDNLSSLSDMTAIESIFFTLGDVHKNASRNQPDPHAVSNAALTERDEKLISDSIERIPDEELQTVIRRVMIKEILVRKSRVPK